MKQTNSKTRLAPVMALLSTLCLLTSAYAQITPLGDAYTNTADPTTNYGAKTLLNVDGASEITYIQFNLSSIPGGASVSQATLKLYVNSVITAGGFNVDYVNGGWTESTINATNAPGLGGTIASNVAITADKNQYILVNVTSAVQAWLNGSQTNDGIALVANGSFNATFDSKENTTTSHPVELDIAYAGGAGTITGITTGSGSGLVGGGTSGTLNLSLLTSCSSTQILQWSGSVWACSNAGTGTINGVTAGAGLTGGGTSGTVSLAVSSSVVPFLAASNSFTGNNSFSSTTGNGLSATSSVAGDSGLFASNTSTVSGNGVFASNYSAGGSAVAGINYSSAAGNAYAIYGQSNGPSGTGVYGTGAANGLYGSSSAGNGVYGQTSSTASGATGVYGNATSASGSNPTYGVYGTTASGAQDSTGVWGSATSASASNGVNGVVGTTNGGAGSAGVTGLSTSASGLVSYGVIGASWYGTAVEANNNYETGGGNSTTIEASNYGSGYVIYAQGPGGTCSIDVKGDLNCSGTITPTAQTTEGRQVKLYGVASPENWFEDFGSGQLSAGSAKISLDPTFASAVNTGETYHVFLTPDGDCKGLYIASKIASGFEVRELGGGAFQHHAHSPGRREARLSRKALLAGSQDLDAAPFGLRPPQAKQRHHPTAPAPRRCSGTAR